MTTILRTHLLRSVALTSLVFTAACGGGGGVESIPTPPPVAAPTPAPVPAPAPAPAPTPPPGTVNYDTPEYRATVGAVSMNALAAYQRSATGLGIKVGVIDSGIDVASQEFDNRISSASASTAGNTTIDDESGHGTAVAFTIAGRRNGAGAHGVAFDSTLVVIRADTPGSCTTPDTTKDDGGCSFGSNAIARGIDISTANGARVINLSLGGSAPGNAVIDAIDRATAAGVIVIIAAGNDSTDNPDPFAGIATSPIARNLVLIAGSVGATDVISDFSDKAGSGANHFLAAVGERVRAPCEDTKVCLWSGTSFAAPQISGAVALLAQAFPNLSGAQIVSILFDTARDTGAAGIDPIYGRGVIDLTRAFSPIGATSVAGTNGSASLSGNATLSAPMGDAAQGTLGAVILDGYSRAFAIDLARTINRNGPARMLTGVLQTRTRNVTATLKGMTVAVTLAPLDRGIAVERTLLSPEDGARARTLAATVTQRLGSNAQFALGFAEGGASLAARLAGRAEPAFLVAHDPGRTQGFDSAVRGSSAIRRQFGTLGITAATENGAVLSRTGGDAQLPALRERYSQSGYNRTSLAFDRRFGGLDTGLTLTRLAERDTVLGARFGDALGAARATSWFVDAATRLDAGYGWSLGASLRQGWTRAEVRGGLGGGGTIRTSGFAADIGKDGVFGRRDSFGLRVAQPLRVARGGIDLRLPVDYDYAVGSVTGWATQRLNLTPTGREIDVEARYGFALFGGDFQTNLFLRRNPGNFATLPNDVGAAVRYSVAF